MPLDRTLGQIEVLEESIKKRSKKLLDYDEERSKANKLAAKSVINIIKLNKQRELEAQARITFESLHNEIIKSFPKLNQAKMVILGEINSRFKNINNRLAVDILKFQNHHVTSNDSKEIVSNSLGSIKRLQITTK